MMPAANQPLSIETRFGTFAANTADVVTMVDGMPGFERCRRFVVVAVSAIEPFACFQGLDAPRPSFLAIDPHLVEPRYRELLTAADRKRLDAADDDTLLWLVLVHLDAETPTVNLRAPIVINPRRMLGLQVLPPDSPYTIDHPLQVG